MKVPSGLWSSEESRGSTSLWNSGTVSFKAVTVQAGELEHGELEVRLERSWPGSGHGLPEGHFELINSDCHGKVASSRKLGCEFGLGSG